MRQLRVLVAATGLFCALALAAHAEGPLSNSAVAGKAFTPEDFARLLPDANVASQVGPACGYLLQNAGNPKGASTVGVNFVSSMSGNVSADIVARGGQCLVTNVALMGHLGPRPPR